LNILFLESVNKSEEGNMERESNPMQALCRSGCGFYGSPATDGLCSLCYKENLKKKQQPPVSATSVPASQTVSGNAGTLQSGFGSPVSTGTTAQPTIPTIPQPTTDLSSPKEVISFLFYYITAFIVFFIVFT
jgi:hypothetical protein